MIEILLVEDSPTDLELTLHSLKKHAVGNRIEVARDGVEALDYLFGKDSDADRSGKNAPGMILLDLKLPRIDGLEVLRRIRADERTRSIPVVVLTSSSEEADIVKCYQLGANSYIQKPVDFEQYSEAVRQICLYWIHLNHSPIASFPLID